MLKLLSAVVLLGACELAGAQTGEAPTTRDSAPMPRDYRGVHVQVDGIFVTPVPNAPFEADVQIVSHEKLPDGSEHVTQTTTHIARSSSGRIRNERHLMVPASFKGRPPLLSYHLYDPNTRESLMVNPYQHIAREMTLRAPLRTPPQQLPPQQMPARPDVVVSDLGTQLLGGVELRGTRKSRTVPATSSGTGQAIEITDEYWYAPQLSIYMIIKHNDPRTGEQLVAVTDVTRGEPAATLMVAPADFKVIDENPPEVPPNNP